MPISGSRWMSSAISTSRMFGSLFIGDPGKPINMSDTGKAFFIQNNIIMGSEQSKYVNSLQIFDNNPGDLAFSGAYKFDVTGDLST